MRIGVRVKELGWKSELGEKEAESQASEMLQLLPKGQAVT